MSHFSSPAVSIDGLSYVLADGTVILDGVSATFPVGHTGLIGANGSGKSTLLALIAGRLTPSSGAIHVHGQVHLVEQRLPASGTIAELLGISETLSALRAIEAGSVEVAHFDAVGDDWDVEARALAQLDSLGLPGDASLLDRPVSSLSGGEATRVALAGARLARADVTLLDEPTNNLDSRTRSWLYDALETWPGSLIVVSHDRDLLERVDSLVDLTRRGATTFGGPFSQYEEYRAGLQESAERRLRDAEAELGRAKRQAQLELQREAQRNRSGRKERALGNTVKAAADFYQNRAEKVSAGKAAGHAQAVSAAEEARAAADDEARVSETIKVALPETTVPAGKRVLRAHVGETVLELVGPARVRLVGDNGAGKSTLLAALLGQTIGDWAKDLLADVTVELAPAVPVGWLGQRNDELDAFDSALEAVRAAAPGRTPHDARALLARFLIRGDKVEQSPSTMSGGERFRVALARTLFAQPAPQLLVLDEPTNNLDLGSVAQLVEALADYRGALLIVTHDEHLAKDLQVTEEWDVSHSERMRVAARGC